MAKWQYKTVRIKETPKRDMDLDVEPVFNQLQDDGWEYVSGPEVVRHEGYDSYIFLVRRAEKSVSSYADTELVGI